MFLNVGKHLLEDMATILLFISDLKPEAVV